MKHVRDVFGKVKKRSERQTGLVCKQGEYAGSIVLKLQRPSWTNDKMDVVQNTSGVFFSIWVELGDKRRLKYNIHALKMRELRGYKVTSREFAHEFRKHFSKVSDGWPNVRTDFGPLTLMEGWMPVDEHHLERDVSDLMGKFESVAPIIDRLLESGRS